MVNILPSLLFSFENGWIVSFGSHETTTSSAFNPKTIVFSTFIYSIDATTMECRKRTFLNSISTGYTSHILAEVESTRNGEYKWGHNMLTLADCRRRVELQFFLGTKQARKRRLAKIRLLIKTLQGFQDALEMEVDLITVFEKAPKKARK